MNLVGNLKLREEDPDPVGSVDFWPAGCEYKPE